MAWKEVEDLEKVRIVSHEKDAIVELFFKDSVEVDEDDAKEIDMIILKMVEGSKFLALTNALNINASITAEARDYFAKRSLLKDIRVAEALLINNLPTRILARFYAYFHRPANPIAIFGNRDEAITWLRSVYKQSLREAS